MLHLINQGQGKRKKCNISFCHQFTRNYYFGNWFWCTAPSSSILGMLLSHYKHWYSWESSIFMGFMDNCCPWISISNELRNTVFINIYRNKSRKLHLSQFLKNWTTFKWFHNIHGYLYEFFSTASSQVAMTAPVRCGTQRRGRSYTRWRDIAMWCTP